MTWSSVLSQQHNSNSQEVETARVSVKGRGNGDAAVQPRERYLVIKRSEDLTDATTQMSRENMLCGRGQTRKAPGVSAHVQGAEQAGPWSRALGRTWGLRGPWAHSETVLMVARLREGTKATGLHTVLGELCAV